MNTKPRWSLSNLSTAANDVVLAVGLAVLSMASVALRVPFVIRSGGFGGGPRADHAFPRAGEVQTSFPRPTASPYSFTLAAAAFLPLAFRRRFPVAVLAVVTVVAAVNDLVPGPPSLVFLAPLIALVAAERRHSSARTAASSVSRCSSSPTSCSRLRCGSS